MKLRSFIVSLLLLVGVSQAEPPPCDFYPLSVAPDSIHVQDGEGTYVWFNGDAAWFPLTELTGAQVELYLSDRESKGFNAILLAVPVPPHWGPTTTVAGHEPFANMSAPFVTPNEPYWAFADSVLERAHMHGITCFVFPAYVGWNNDANQGWGQEMKAAGVVTMKAFGEWLGARYLSQPNIVWVHGGDTNVTDAGMRAAMDSLAAGLASIDAVHLATAHCSRPYSAFDCYSRLALDIDATYAYGSRAADQTSLRIQQDYGVGQPTVFIEGRYECATDGDLGNWTPTVGRKQFWWSLLGGEQGYFHGNERMWDFCDTGESSVGCATGGCTYSWQVALDSPGTAQVVYGNNLRLSRPWQRLVPDYTHALVDSGYSTLGADTYVGAARSSDSTFAWIYDPNGGRVRVNLGKMQGPQVNIYRMYVDTTSNIVRCTSSDCGSGVLFTRATSASPLRLTASSEVVWIIETAGTYTSYPNNQPPTR